jgi:hypothetical protein
MAHYKSDSSDSPRGSNLKRDTKVLGTNSIFCDGLKKLFSTMTVICTRFWIVLVSALLAALVSAGTRPEDAAWLAAKAKEDGVVATGTGLLYKGAFCHVSYRRCDSGTWTIQRDMFK